MSVEDIEDITLTQRIENGHIKGLYLTLKQGYKERFVTKKINKKFLTHPEVKISFDDEINILKEVKHPNIVNFVDLKETNTYYYLVFELCNGGSLSECLEEYKKKYKKPFTEEIVQFLMKQIVSVTQYLHNNHIVHHNLKLDNILVKFENDEDKYNLNMLKSTVKFIDFEFAVKLTSIDLEYLCGFILPNKIVLDKLNKIRSHKNFGYEVKAENIWFLGSLCYEMLVGKPIFDTGNMNGILSSNVTKSDYYYLPITISKEAVSFLNGMLQYYIKKRLSADELSSHHFLTKKINEFTPINLKKVKNIIEGRKLKINSKQNQLIWLLFDTDRPKLDNISQVVKPLPKATRDPQEKSLMYGGNYSDLNLNNNKNYLKNDIKINDVKLKEEFLKAQEIMNSDFICIETKMIPIILGDDPAVINRASKFFGYS